MFAPILPRPIIPSCINHSFANAVARLVEEVSTCLMLARSRSIAAATSLISRSLSAGVQRFVKVDASHAGSFDFL
jgi:hypothetical protein